MGEGRRGRNIFSEAGALKRHGYLNNNNNNNNSTTNWVSWERKEKLVKDIRLEEPFKQAGRWTAGVEDLTSLEEML